MREYTEWFEAGQIVRLIAPAPEEEEYFTSGWLEDGMRTWEGRLAEVIQQSEAFPDRYMVCLYPKKEWPTSYWWNARFMESVPESKDVSDEEYANVLFES